MSGKDLLAGSVTLPRDVWDRLVEADQLASNDPSDRRARTLYRVAVGSAVLSVEVAP